jgi:exodeoxyribonuclease V alpha subunit
MLLERNLIYTGITRARKFLVVVGQKKALGMAIKNDQSRKRYSGLLHSMMKQASPQRHQSPDS